MANSTLESGDKISPYDCGVTAEQAAEALKQMGEIMREIPLPSFQEIRIARLNRLKQFYGADRYFMRSYWTWLLANKYEDL